MCAAAFATLPGSMVGDERRCRVALRLSASDPLWGTGIKATCQCQRACSGCHPLCGVGTAFRCAGRIAVGIGGCEELLCRTRGL